MNLPLLRSIIVISIFTGLVSAADPQLMNLLMPDVKVVAGMNVDQAKASPFGQFLLARAQAQDQALSKLAAATGFDPRNDLREVLMGTTGRLRQNGLVLARGNFDTVRILAAAQAAGQKVESYKGVNILTGQEESMTHALAFLDNSIAIAGDLDSVHGAIDRRSAANAIDPALSAKVGQLSGSMDVWSVSIVPLATLANHQAPNPDLNGMLSSDALKSIQQTSGGVKFGATVRLSAEAVAGTDKDATALADVVRFLGLMVQSNAPTEIAAAITSLVQSLSVQTDGNTVKLALAIPEEQLESFVRSAEQGKSLREHRRL